jgi:hypothetical protein
MAAAPTRSSTRTWSTASPTPSSPATRSIPQWGARRITVADRPLWELRDGQRDVVVFTRQGHTCVLAGHVMSRHTLERLATWRGDGSIHF